MCRKKYRKHATVVMLHSCNHRQSVHLSDELVDVGLPVTKVASLHEVLELPCPPSTSRVRELEGPQEVGGLEKCINTESIESVKIDCIPA